MVVGLATGAGEAAHQYTPVVEGSKGQEAGEVDGQQHTSGGGVRDLALV